MAGLATVNDLKILQRELASNSLKLPRYDSYTVVSQWEFDVRLRNKGVCDGFVYRRFTLEVAYVVKEKAASNISILIANHF